jgi:hypothetical protein
MGLEFRNDDQTTAYVSATETRKQHNSINTIPNLCLYINYKFNNYLNRIVCVNLVISYECGVQVGNPMETQSVCEDWVELSVYHEDHIFKSIYKANGSTPVD